MINISSSFAARLILVCSYLLISATPFFPLLLGRTVDHGATILLLECFFWLLLWSLFQRPAFFHWLLLPVFLVLPIEIYLQLFFSQGISPHHLGLLVETSPKEAVEFLGTKIWLLCLILFTILLWWVSLQVISTSLFVWHHYTRWVCLLCLALASFIFTYGEEFGYAPSTAEVNASAGADAGTEAEDASEAEADDVPATRFEAYTAAYRDIAPPLPAWLETSIDKKLISQCWPFGLAVHFGDFLYERHYLSVLTQKSSAFQFHAHADTSPSTIVLIIGESSRYDRWSLNGYARATTPLLQKEPLLIPLGNMISGVSATRLSVPVIVSRKPITQSLKAGFAEKSVLSAFKEAGYKTFWLSNQMSFGEFDTPVSVFANEADVTQFLNLGGFTNQSSLDQVLLTPFNNALHDAAPKKLIVLHTLGNHWNYSHRHPDNFNHWMPSLSGVSDPDYNDRKFKEQMNNSYDNSILYTDWFLTQTIHLLDQQSSNSAMVYVSDHGQTIYDGTCNLAFHGHNTDYEFHIPAFMWYSSLYAQSFPAKIEQLKLHQHARLSTENLFHSLLDMANIHYPDEHLDRSFVSERFKPHVRYVDSYGWSNYDDASFKGDCREVIDHHHPLKQEK